MKRINKNKLLEAIERAEKHITEAKRLLDENATENNEKACKKLLNAESLILYTIVSPQSQEYKMEIIEEIEDMIEVDSCY